MPRYIFYPRFFHLTTQIITLILLGLGPAQAKTYFIHTDHLGTPQAMTDADQTVVWTADHTPFGEAVVDEDPDGDGEKVTMNLRFPGQYYDEETGLHYNYQRYYDPSTGRYITSDPIGVLGGLNTYGYVSGNPIRFTDSKGLLIDTIADIGFILYDIYAIGRDNVFNDCDNFDTNLGALGADVAGLFIPVASGLGLGVRTTDKAIDLTKSINIVQKDGNVVELLAKGSSGDIKIVTEMVKNGDQLVLKGTHIDGVGAGASSISELRKLAREFGRQQGVKEVIIEGGRRTTGANPGKIPIPIRIKVD